MDAYMPLNIFKINVYLRRNISKETLDSSDFWRSRAGLILINQNNFIIFFFFFQNDYINFFFTYNTSKLTNLFYTSTYPSHSADSCI